MPLAATKPTVFIPFENLDDPSPVQTGTGIAGLAQQALGPGGNFGPGSPFILWEYLDDPAPVQLGHGLIYDYRAPAASAPVSGLNLKTVLTVVGVLALVGAAVFAFRGGK